MGDGDDGPDPEDYPSDHSEGVGEDLIGDEVVQDDTDHKDDAGDGYGSVRAAALVECSQRGRCVARSGKGHEHAAGCEDGSVAGGEQSRDSDEGYEASGGWQTGMGEDEDEWTLLRIEERPWVQHHDDGKGADVEEKHAKENAV